MGMYTSIVDCDVPIRDMAGLKKYLELCKEGKVPYSEDMEKALEINEDSKTLDFYGMDGWKIISYWYDGFVAFLRDLAFFLGDGWVRLEFENEDETGNIQFEDGKCIIHWGQVQWNQCTADEHLKETPSMTYRLHDRKLGKFDIPEKVKEIVAISNI